MRDNSACSELHGLEGTMTIATQEIPSGGTIRWGIVGTGRIARRFAEGLAHVPQTQLTALWSRRAEPAVAFAGEFGGEVCASFDALLASGIHALYIAKIGRAHV